MGKGQIGLIGLGAMGMGMAKSLRRAGYRVLVFDVRRINGAKVMLLGLALGPFRGLIKDYQLLVDSHAKAVEEGRETRIQAIDMGRRGLHNEGAALLCQRLDGKIAIDFETARRLFTLVCVLHTRVQG